ncbi:MAG TPA: POTRA domain-containing protein, partial [Puia sp.]
MLRRSLICVFLLISYCLLNRTAARAQVTDTTHPVSVDPALIDLTNPKNPPREFTIAGIKITGTKYLDESLLTSISGLSVGDKVTIPGGDNFSKAINNLWGQKLFANIEIYFTKVVGSNIYIEIEVAERPRLSNFFFKGSGVKKGDGEDLGKKTNLVKGRVVTEAMKRSAIEAIKRFYADKGYQDAKVTIIETKDPTVANSEILTFNIGKGPKVRINEINIFGNEQIADAKLKKQFKDTHERSRLTIYPPPVDTTFGPNPRMTFK